MRRLGTALLLFTALAATAQQPAESNSAFSGKLSIPVEVSHTVRADKAHPGDPVEFETLQAVLVSKDLVMPAGTRLRGHVLRAGAKQEGKNSYLSLVVERAEWKAHTLPLHAFIAAQITVTPKMAAATPEQTSAPPPASRRANRASARGAAAADPSLSGMIRTPQDATDSTPAPVVAQYPRLEDVGFFRDKDGITYLLSSKSNVKLPAGVLLMLQNQPPVSSEPTPGSNTSSVNP